MVVFVGHVPRTSADGVVLATVNTLGSDYPQQCIVVSMPDNGDVIWKATLQTTASKADIAKAVSRAAAPFRPVVIQQPRSAAHCPT